MPLATLFDKALLATLDAAFAACPPGLVLSGLPAEPAGWLARLVAALGQDERYYVSVVGADAALRATLPQPLPGDWRFGLDATHAVAVRNALELPATARRVVVMLRPEARLHSLRQRNYGALGPADMVRHLALQQAATDVPLPQKQLWTSLAAGQPAVPLLAFLDFYQAVVAPDAPDASNTLGSPREELYRLELLPDPSLFDQGARGGVRERLTQNAELTQRLLLGDPADEQTAHKQCVAAAALDAGLAHRLRAAYAAFRSLNPAEPLPPQLRALDLPLVRQLLGEAALPSANSTPPLPEPPIVAEPDPTDESAPLGEPADPNTGPGGEIDPDEEDPTGLPPTTGGRSGEAGGSRAGAGPKKKYPKGLDDAVVRLAAGDVAGLPGGWHATAAKLLANLRVRLHKDPTSTKPLETTRVQVAHGTHAVALALTQDLLGPELLGGVLAFPGLSTADEAVAMLALAPADLPPAAPAWDAAWLNELRRFLRTADGLVPTLAGAVALENYLAARAALCPHAALLASAPLSAVVLDDELRALAGQAIAAYHQLLRTVANSYLELQSHNRAGYRLASQLLRLDVVEVRAGNAQRIALLSALHPLVLWKQLELARLVLAGPTQARELLDVLDRPGSRPEPLRALVLPTADTFPTVALAQADRLGASWPVYRPTGLERVTVGEKLLTDAARKLAVLYPPVRRCLRVFVQHPASLESVSDALKALWGEQSKDREYERFEVLIGLLPGQPVSLLPFDRLLTEGVMTVETRVVEHVADVSEWLRQQPVHLLVLSGQRHIHPLPIGRDAAHLHPLSLPQVLEYDQFDPQQPLVLRPRGQQPSPDDDALSWPFAAFHTLAAEVAGQPGREWSGGRSKPAPDGTQPALLPLTVLLLLSAETPTADDPAHVLVLARQGGLAGEAVLTRWNQRYVKGVRDAVLSGLNYAADADATSLLRRLEATGHMNLLHTISAHKDAKSGFLPSALKGQLGLAVALRWYEDEATDHFHLTLSLDSPMARHWLARRETGRRSDLLGLRRRPADGGLSFDLLEVKAHAVSGDLDAPDQPGPQLRAVARALLPILTQTGGDMLTDCRRELLREQLFHEGRLGLPPDVEVADWAAWIKQLNNALDGQAAPQINLLLIEVIAGDYFEQKEAFTPGNPAGETVAERAPIRRITLGEKNIQDYLKAKPAAGPDPARPARPVPQPSPTPNSAITVASAAPAATVDAPAPEVFPVPPTPSAGSAANQEAEFLATPTVVASFSAPSAQPTDTDLTGMASDLYATLQDFNIRLARPIDPALADAGPSLVRFKVELARGQSDKPVRGLATDIQRGMRLHHLPRIENLPGTQFLFVEVPRANPRPVLLLPLLDQEAAQPSRPIGSFPAGIAPDGVVRWLNIPDARHMLVGGTSGSGKSMFLNSLIISLTRLQPLSRLKLVLIDPKGAEFSFFKRLPHLLTPIIREPQPAIDTLADLMSEEYPRRRDLLEQQQCLNIQDYYKIQPPETMPLIVIVIDELETFLDSMGKTERATFEGLLGSIARLTRYVGIHLVVATQRPDSKVIYGNLKNNLDCRIAFRLASNTDSRVILKGGGAEDLMGAGDMLLQTDNSLQRLQGFFLPTEELRRL